MCIEYSVVWNCGHSYVFMIVCDNTEQADHIERTWVLTDPERLIRCLVPDCPEGDKFFIDFRSENKPPEQWMYDLQKMLQDGTLPLPNTPPAENLEASSSDLQMTELADALDEMLEDVDRAPPQSEDKVAEGTVEVNDSMDCGMEDQTSSYSGQATGIESHLGVPPDTMEAKDDDEDLDV